MELHYYKKCNYIYVYQFPKKNIFIMYHQHILIKKEKYFKRNATRLTCISLPLLGTKHLA